MKILNKKIEKLNYTYEVLIEKVEIDSLTDSKLIEKAKTYKTAGFRPGKVPMEIIRRTFGESAGIGAKQELLDKCTEAAIKDMKEHISLRPKQKVILDDEEGLKFEVEFSIIPDVEIPNDDINSLDIIKHELEITDADIDEFILNIVNTFAPLKEIEGEVQDNQHADIQLTRVDSKGEAIKGFDDKIQISIDKNKLLPEIYEAVIGMKKDDEKIVVVKYPENVSDKKLAGKEIQYKIKLLSLKTEEKQTVVTEDLIKTHTRFDTLENAREKSKLAIESRFSSMLDVQLKYQVFDKLQDKLSYDIPDNMLEIEYINVIQQVRKDAESEGYVSVDNERLEKECRMIAINRVRLGILITKIAKEEGIMVTNQEFSNKVQSIAMSARNEKEYKQFIDYYLKDEIAKSSVFGELLEEKVVKYITTKTKNTVEKISLKKLEEMDNEVFDFFYDCFKKVEGKMGGKKGRIADEPGVKKNDGVDEMA